MSDADTIRSFDVRPDRLDLRDRKYRPRLVNLPPCFPSESIVKDLLVHYQRDCGLILDQGSEGACTGFGLAAVINYLNWRDEFLLIDSQGNQSLVTNKEKTCVLRVSERMLYNNARIYDEWDGEEYEGSSCRGAMKGWHRHGVCKEGLWPYRNDQGNVAFIAPKVGWATSARDTPLGSYYRISQHSVVDMQSAICEVGAIYCSAQIHQGWKIPVRGVEDEQDAYSYLPSISRGNTGQEIGCHAFAIVGFTQNGFIVQNSWGKDWGYCGFALLEYDDWVRRGLDAWVAVRGAPTNTRRSPHTVVHQSLQEIGAQSDDPEALQLESIKTGYSFDNDSVQPWDEETAYQHAVVIGNNGRAIQKIISVETPEDCIELVAHDRIAKWIQETGHNKVAIYAHGGLDCEKASIRRIQIMAPYFYQNGVYPIFITWKSGLIETIVNIIDERWNKSQGDGRAGYVIEDAGQYLSERVDRSLEVFARKFGGKSIWSEMKENAMLASSRRLPSSMGAGPGSRGALVNLATQLLRHDNVELHLIGHSAGSIILGYWLEVLTKLRFNINTLSLYAPACSVRFANRYFVNAVKSGILDKSAMYFDILSDEREKADSVGPYRKSMLYLVSRALEDMHKEPLLGLEATWSRDKLENVYMDRNRRNITEEEKSRMKELDRWQEFMLDRSGLSVHEKNRSQVMVSRKDDWITLSHGSFVNDIKVVEKSLKRIVGRSELKTPIENLGGF